MSIGFTFPLFVSSVLASIVWQRQYRGWAFFWRSLEVEFYATTLMFLLCRSLSDFTGDPPAIGLQLTSIAMITLAIVLALKRKVRWWRVL